MDQDILAALARIEQRQIAYEAVAHQTFDTLAVHTEMLQAIMEAATADPGPSPVAEALKQILTAMQETTRLLQQLPEAIGATIREELQREGEEAEWEPAEPDAFDREGEDTP